MNSSAKLLAVTLLSFLLAMMFVCLPRAQGVEFGSTSRPEQYRPALLVQEIPDSPAVEQVRLIATQSKALTLERLRPILVPKSGPGYRTELVVGHSHYFDPIIDTDGLAGRSRRWGDAPLAVQAVCVARLVKDLRSHRFTEDEVAFAIALCRHESGFNPDAAAGTSSACGLGQFLDRTRRVLSLRAGALDLDPFSVDLNVVCLRETLKECFAFARKHAETGTNRYFQYAYAYHHDGPALKSGGLEIAEEKVLPWLEVAQECISE